MIAQLLYTDKELLEKIAGGNENAFSMLSHRYMARIYKYAMNYTKGQVQPAEEITQDIFLDIWIHAKMYSTTVNKFEAFLYVMVKRSCFNYLRKSLNENKARLEWATRNAVTEVLNDDPVAVNDVQKQLNSFIAKLPARQGIVYLMHHQGFKLDEIAEVMNISKLTVKTHLTKAGKMVRAFFANVKPFILPGLPFLSDIFYQN